MTSPGPLHTCELCGQEGLTEPQMRSHMKVEHVEGSPACPFCDLTDVSPAEMVSGGRIPARHVMVVS